MYLKEYFKKISPILLLIIIAILIGSGNNGRMISFFLIIFFAFFRFIPWEYFFFIGLTLAPFKIAGIVDFGFRVQMTHVFLISGILGAFLDKKEPLIWKPGIFDVRIVVGVLVLLISVIQSRFIPADPVVILGAFRNYPWIKGLSRVFFISVLIGLAFFIRSYILNKEYFFKLLHIIFITCTVYSFIGIVGFVLYSFGFHYFFGVDLVTQTADEWQRIKVFELEPLFYGGYLLTVLPLMLVLLLKENTIMQRKSFFIMSIINVVALMLTFSRSVWAGFLISLIIIFYYCRDRIIFIIHDNNNYKDVMRSFIKKNFLSICIFLYLFLFLILFFKGSDIKTGFFNSFIDPIFDAFDPNAGKFWSTKLRLLTIEIGWREFIKHPLFGIGFENFSFYSGNIFFYQLLDFAINYPSISNLPLKLLFETGVIGFFILCILLISFLFDICKLIKKTKNEELRDILIGYFACIFAFLGQSLFISHFFSVWLWIAVGSILTIVNLIKE